MRHVRRSNGFTLVELVIVLALSALVLSGVLAGSGVLQRRTELSSAVDAVRLQLKGIQSEAFQTVSQRSDNKAGTSDETTFGKLVEFENQANATTPGGEKQMKVWTLVESADKSTLYKCNEQDESLPLQMSFMDAKNGATTNGFEAVIFGHNPNQTYVVPSFGDPQNGNSPGADCKPPASPAPTAPSPPIACTPASQGNPTGSCPTPPPPAPVPDACNIGLWQCGLYGQYYKNTTLSGSPNTAYIDYQVGTNLDSSGFTSSYPSFNTALTNRAKAPKLGDSVHWQGQVLLNDEPGDFPTPPIQHTYCFQADQGSTATITIGATVYTMTSTFGQLTASVGPHCVAIPTNVTPGWYNIDIKYNTSINGTAYAQLYETTGATTQEVPDSYLRTDINNKQIDPPNAFAKGLYGQYYNDVSFGNRISAYTDPVIGDGGSQFSFDSANALASGAIIDADTFSPVLRWNTASSDSAQRSVKWTGQILVDTTGPQQYCDIADDNATIVIDGATLPTTAQPIIPPGTWPRLCGMTPSLTAGWHNLEVDYKNICCAGAPTNGGGANARLEVATTNGSGKTTYNEVKNNHLRRPMDWSADGNVGTCDASNSACVHSSTGLKGNVSSTGTWSSSTTSPGGSCNNSNHLGQITYTKNNQTPDTTYNLDISYFNEPDANLPVPSGYSYLVCVAVNGTTLNGGNPISMPISEPSLNARTYTLSGVAVPASGNFTVTLDWINDAYFPPSILCGFFGTALCGYDANFGVSRIDLYRNLLPSGSLSKTTASSAAHLAAAAKSTSAPSRQTVAASLLNMLLPVAHAAIGCDVNVLNPQNYTTTCFGAPQTSTLHFQVSGQPGVGNIDITTQDNSIERSITN